jgi:hypothetical protein
MDGRDTQFSWDKVAYKIMLENTMGRYRFEYLAVDEKTTIKYSLQKIGRECAKWIDVRIAV